MRRTPSARPARVKPGAPRDGGRPRLGPDRACETRAWYRSSQQTRSVLSPSWNTTGSRRCGARLAVPALRPGAEQAADIRNRGNRRHARFWYLGRLGVTAGARRRDLEPLMTPFEILYRAFERGLTAFAVVTWIVILFFLGW